MGKLFTAIRHVPKYFYNTGKVFYQGMTDVNGAALQKIISSGHAAAESSIEFIDTAKGVSEEIVSYTVRPKK